MSDSGDDDVQPLMERPESSSGSESSVGDCDDARGLRTIYSDSSDNDDVPLPLPPTAASVDEVVDLVGAMVARLSVGNNGAAKQTTNSNGDGDDAAATTSTSTVGESHPSPENSSQANPNPNISNLSFSFLW